MEHIMEEKGLVGMGLDLRNDWVSNRRVGSDRSRWLLNILKLNVSHLVLCSYAHC